MHGVIGLLSADRIMKAAIDAVSLSNALLVSFIVAALATIDGDQAYDTVK